MVLDWNLKCTLQLAMDWLMQGNIINKRFMSFAFEKTTSAFKPQKTLGDCAYMCAAPKLWNSLPCQVRNESDLSKFKILLKTHLSNLAFN